MFRSFAFAAIALLSLPQLASAAPIYEVDIDNPPQGNLAGQITNITTRYNANTGLFSWQHTIEDTASNKSDGFWLVVSDGPMPNKDEYTIFYGDVAKGVVSAYQYDIDLGAYSFTEMDRYLTTYALDYNHSGSAGTFSFEVNTGYLNDASNFPDLNNPGDWKGTLFNEWIGAWFAPTLDTVVTYFDTGEIDTAKASTNGWVDGSYYKTTEVPEPSTGFLFALAALFIGGTRILRK